MRRHALVVLGLQINWLFRIDPIWSSPDGDALWDGILWANRVPHPRSLYLALKETLLARAKKIRSPWEHAALAGYLLLGWGSEGARAEGLITNIELREVLIHTSDEFRRKLLWQLERWCNEPGDISWRERVVPFFTYVWPKQRSLHTAAMSTHLANFALASGDLMPAVVELILPRLVPVRNTSLRFGSTSGTQPTETYPAATLALLFAILGEDASSWSFGVGQALELLGHAPETASDPKLSELRRRLDLS